MLNSRRLTWSQSRRLDLKRGGLFKVQRGSYDLMELLLLLAANLKLLMLLLASSAAAGGNGFHDSLDGGGRDRDGQVVGRSRVQGDLVAAGVGRSLPGQGLWRHHPRHSGLARRRRSTPAVGEKKPAPKPTN